MELAAELRDVIHLEVGEPDSNTPDSIIGAALEAARRGHTKYTPNAGMRTLREGLSRKVEIENGLRVTPEQIVVTAGAVCALATAVFATVDPGDEVLIPDPGWPNYVSMVVLAGGVPVRYVLPRAGGYLPDVEALRTLVSPRTKLLFVNTPSNPTGAVYPEATVLALVEFAAEHDLYVLSDEVYEAFVFEGRHEPAARFDQDGRVITVFGFSKTYAMTGWRLGYAVASPEVATLMAKIQEPLVSCASSVAQKGAEAALAMPREARPALCETYRARRDRVVEILGSRGLLPVVPRGAFYALVDLSAVGPDSNTSARRLLTEERVATAPGETFGTEARGMVRISLATATEPLEEGCRRIVRFVERHRSGRG
jgi:aspartate aminotransferase/aminotransferase